MEMFCFGILAGAIITMLLIMLERLTRGDKDDRDSENKPGRDRGGGTDIPLGSGKFDGVVRDIPSREEVEVVLYLLRVGASNREKRVIDYLIDKEDL